MSLLHTTVGTIGVASAGWDHAATPILFLHGVGSTKEVWRPQLAHFGAHRPAYAIDYPGYGESEFRAAATLDDFADAALAALDALGIEQAHICGLSLGGVVAIALHHRAAARCASLILADTFAAHPDGPGIFQRSIDASRTMTMADLAAARAPLLLGSAATDGMRAVVIQTMASINPDAFRLGAAAVWLADQRGRAAAINVPTLVLVGEEDRITPPALSAELAAMIVGAQLETIAKAGHLINLEKPDEYNRLVDRFLSEMPATIEG
ncbi:MAG: alpha/beta hydrolase [Sphingomonas bacterium]|nr:alpha/beta hydrolase [Sphingomonas bacterium]